MSGDLAEYVRAGYSLSPEQRLEAARLLRLSVDHDEEADQSSIDEAWRAEISSRVDEVIHGKVDLVDAEETFRMLSAELSAKQA